MRRPLSLIAALCLLPCAPGARAQDAPPPAPPPAAPTLAQALAQAEVSRDTVSLAVAADRVTPPRDMTPLPPGAPVSQVADAYGRLVQSWETAAAVAPPAMTVLNTDPGAARSYDGVPPGETFKMLAGSLDDGQWQALAGDQGLGYADLTERGQQDQFIALFAGAWGIRTRDDSASEHVTPLAADALRQSRLRLCQQINLFLPVTGPPGTHVGIDSDSGRVAYVASPTSTAGPAGTLYGVQLRATVPNAPKPSDLDAAAMTAPVPLAGVRTVGDLVRRIGSATRTELYADRRYESRSVTLVGPPSARAGDLLRALALCVTGTYRKVGPAYVLTDDVLGLGRRQMILARFARGAEMARGAAAAAAGDKFIAHGGVLGLPPTEPGLGVTDAQQAAQKGVITWDPFSVVPQMELPFGRLTPEQQDLARRGLRAQPRDAATGAPSYPMTLDGTVLLQPRPVLHLLLPGGPAPVTLDVGMDVGQFFQPSAKVQRQLDAQLQARLQAQSAPPPADAGAARPATTAAPPSLAALLAPLPRRAVLSRPRSAPEVDALIVGMRRLGLNQLWLDVFSGGKSRLEGAGTPDILTEALARTKGTGIAVIPAMDLLSLGGDAPQTSLDRTVLGETSAQDADFQWRYAAATRKFTPAGGDDAQPPAEAPAARPDAAAVEQRLTALVRRLAATPGVAVLALRDTAPSGYAPGSGYGVNGSDLGYTLPLRLACLRRAHVDPVDLDVRPLDPVAEQASLPDFDTPDAGPAMQDVGTQWDAVRAEADLGLMRRLLSAAQAGAGHPVPFLVRQRGMAWACDWWGLWTGPDVPLPELALRAALSGRPGDFAAVAHSQCRVVIYTPQAWAVASAVSLSIALQSVTRGWDGIVIDDTADLDNTAGAAGTTLAALVKSLAPAAAPVAVRKP